MNFVGLDLGQQQDWTAISVVDVVGPADAVRRQAAGIDSKPIYRVRYLERPPLGTPYPVIVDRVQALLGKLSQPQLVIDATGVGRPVVDLFDQRGIYAQAVTITGGSQQSQDGRDLRVPKRDLVGACQVLLQTGRLQVAAALTLQSTLVRELQSFRVKISANAHDSYSARDGEHDDLVLSVGLACWAAVRDCNDSWWIDPMSASLAHHERAMLLGKRADDRARRRRADQARDPDGLFDPLETE